MKKFIISESLKEVILICENEPMLMEKIKALSPKECILKSFFVKKKYLTNNFL